MALRESFYEHPEDEQAAPTTLAFLEAGLAAASLTGEQREAVEALLNAAGRSAREAGYSAGELQGLSYGSR